MADNKDNDIAEKLRKNVMERLPHGGTREDVQRVVEEIILGDDDDLDESQDVE